MPAAPRQLLAQPLEGEAFAAFGQVLAIPEAPGLVVNRGTAQRHDWRAAIESTRPGAKPNVALFRCDPQSLPFRATSLERHPHSTQLFAALAARRWLVVVTPSRPDGRPDESAARAFVCGPGQGINLAPGVWHHPVIALDERADLLMLAWEDGGGGDCEEHALAGVLEITAPPE